MRKRIHVPLRAHRPGETGLVPEDDLGVRAKPPAEAVAAHEKRIAALRARSSRRRYTGVKNILAAFRRGETVAGISAMSHRSVEDIEDVLRQELRRRREGGGA